MEVVRYFMRLYRRWKYLRTPRPVFEPTVTPVERHWTAIDEKLERELYLANPHAVWLRPDRDEHKVPCWQIEGFWEAPPLQPLSQYSNVAQSYSQLSLLQQCAFPQSALIDGMFSGAQMKRAAMIQKQYYDQLAQTAGLNAYGNYNHQNSLAGLGSWEARLGGKL
jgi:hypothetical protein